MRNLVVIMIFAVTSAMEWKQLFVHDCNDGLHLLTDTPLAMNMNGQSLKLISEPIAEMLYERATCMCPGLTKAEHLRFILPSIEMLLGLSQGDSYKLGLQAAANQVCACDPTACHSSPCISDESEVS